jgi:hypothetical protein
MMFVGNSQVFSLFSCTTWQLAYSPRENWKVSSLLNYDGTSRNAQIACLMAAENAI